MIYIDCWDSVNDKGERHFHGYLSEPQFSHTLKQISADIWALNVNYRKGTYEIWRGHEICGVSTWDICITKAKDMDTAYTLDTTYSNWENTFERILSKQGLKAWEIPTDWKWPEFVPLEMVLTWIEAHTSNAYK